MTNRWTGIGAGRQLMKLSTCALLLAVVAINLNVSDSLTIIPLRQMRSLDLLTSLLQSQQVDRRAHRRSLAPRNKYCAVDKQHTACKFTKRDQDGQCGEVSDRGFNAADQKFVLKVHNDLRAKVAKGEQPGQPGASNMNELVWDEESAAIAQLWADQCVDEHDQTDMRLGYKRRGTVMSTPKVQENGQNIGTTSASPPGSSKSKQAAVEGIVKSWFSEVESLNPQAIKKFGNEAAEAGHYTEMVWGELRSVGCGYIRYVDGENWEHSRLICNYGGGGGGNMQGKPVYTTGKPCSNCPADMRTCVNGALCRKRSGRSLMLPQLFAILV